MPLYIFEGCRSKKYLKNNTIHLHKLPKDVNLRAKWVSQIKNGSNVQKVNCDTGIIKNILKLTKIEHVFCLNYI